MSELHSKMTALADAVREKAELTDTLTIDEMTAAVRNLNIGGGITPDVRTISITPTKGQQTFMSSELGENAYYGTVTVNAIPDDYITTADATAASSDILEGKTAYVSGQKRTGSMTNHGDVVKTFNNGSNTLIIPANGYYSTIKVTLTKKNLTITPSAQKQTFDVLVDEESDVFYSRVTVDPIPSDYIITADATAESVDIIKGKTAYVNGQKVTGVYKSVNEEDVRSGVEFGAYSVNAGTPIVPRTGSFTDDATAADRDILEGKTAYVHGKKRVGIIATVTATLEGNVVTVPKGYIAEPQTITIPEMPAVSVHLNAISIGPGYNKEVQSITIGNAVEATTYTPGVADIVIPKKSYLVDDHIIKGDINLTSENIAAGVSVFNLTGTFTADATAAASDIFKGKSAYVNGKKVTGTYVPGARPDILVSNDQRQRWFSLDYSGNIISVQTSPGTAANLIVVNGDAVRVFGPADYNEARHSAQPVTGRTDIQSVYYRGEGGDGNSRYLFLTIDGTVYGWEGRIESEKTVLPLALTQVATGVNDVCPSDDGRYWLLSGTTAYLYSDHQLNDTHDGIIRFVSHTATSVSYGSGHGLLALNTSGELVVLYSEEDYAHSFTVSPAPVTGSSWQDVCFYGYEAYEGGGCYVFATDTAGVLWFAQSDAYDLMGISQLKYSEVGGITGVKTQPGYCITGVFMNWNEETGEETYTPYVNTVALVIDGSGRLWKLTAALNGTALNGVSKVQVGEDTDWKYCEPQINRNGKCLAQKGDNLVLLSASNTDDCAITYTSVKDIAGCVVKHTYSPSSGDWCAVIVPEVPEGDD